MAPKSRRKKKYAGQRSPQTIPASVAVPSKAASRPAPSGLPAAQTVRTAAKVQTQMATSPSAANVGRELRTIAVLAGVLLVALVVISLVLT